jgi:DnaJ-class molecular chaperone
MEKHRVFIMNINTADYYELLNISRDASDEEIKKSFRIQALLFHPDRHKGDAEKEEMFKRISEAYEVLSDPQKRLFYDRTGSYSGLNSFFGGGHQSGRGCGGGGCGRGRGAMWRMFMARPQVFDIHISRERAIRGAEIPIILERADGSEEKFTIRLPHDVQEGEVVRFSAGAGTGEYFIRVHYGD